MVKKYGELYLQARKALRPMDGDDASSEARELLAWLSGKTPEKILTLGLSILFQRWLFPHDQKTLQALHDEYTLLRQKLRDQIARLKEKRGKKQ